ncbi:hypothetical protein [Helicobacter pylori]|nr:hypothetical protein [Helicobacter pylori]
MIFSLFGKNKSHKPLEGYFKFGENKSHKPLESYFKGGKTPRQTK